MRYISLSVKYLKKELDNAGKMEYTLWSSGCGAVGSALDWGVTNLHDKALEPQEFQQMKRACP